MSGSAGVLIVGGSVAGLRTAEGLRRLAYAGTITILEAGDELPYDRTALSKKALRADCDDALVRLRSQGDLDRLGLDLRLRSPAESLDVAGHAVRLADGTTFEYAVLVVATGSTAVELPGISRSAAHYLRTLADARSLRTSMESARRAVVVGAGFIGSEVAAAISVRGGDVTLIEPASFPLYRVLGDIVGARLAQLHEGRGIHIVPGRAVTAVHETGSPATPYRAVLDDGSFVDTELVVVGAGARANVRWLDGSGVALADGVVCDEFCRAGTPGVFAAGDVARWPNPLFGETMRIEHWTNAMEQASAVAWNIANAGQARAYAPVPYVWSDQYGLRLQIVGRPRPDDEVRIVDDDPVKEVLVAIYTRQGRMSGAFTLNAPAKAIALRRSLATRASPERAAADISR